MIKQTRNSQTISAVAILAGGQSQRMGQPKALLEYDGKSLLDHHIGSACKLGLSALICSDINDYTQHIKPDYRDNCVHIKDSISQQGALPAILGAMKYQETQCDLSKKCDLAKNSWLAVLSVDSLITADTLLTLFTQYGALLDTTHTDIFYLYDDVANKDYPLLGIYRLDVLDKLNEYVAVGNRRVMRFLDLVNCTTVNIPTEWQSLTNINTPDDFQNALMKLNSKNTNMTDSKNTPSNFTHLDAKGNASMVDVGDKAVTKRTAVAQAVVQFPAAVYAELKATGGQTKKGAITDIARISGIMAGKKTSDLIPLCHPMPLEKVAIAFDYDDDAHHIIIQATAQVTHKTGVEMEALTAVTVASLTIYDMCKALSHDIRITDVCLLEKTGGKRNFSRD